MTPPVTSSPRRKRVALVYHFFAHYRGAVLQELTSNSVHDYTLVGDDEGQEGIEAWPIPPQVPFRRAPMIRFRGIDVWQRGVLSLAWKREFDAIVYLGNAKWPSTWASAILARLLGKEVYFWTHGWTKTSEGGLKGLFRRVFYRVANGLLLYGHLAKAVGLNCGFDASRLHVIYNSLDYSAQRLMRGRVSQERLEEIRQDLFGDTYTPVVICSTRLIRIRRLDLLIESLALLRSAGHEVNLLLVGDGPERANLQKLANEKDVRVAFIGACYDEARLAELTMAANVTVAPGKVGLTAMQSLAYGTPVITHGDAEDQMPEWEAILPSLTGDHFIKGDTRDLADRVHRWTSTAWTKPETRDECIRVIERFYTPGFQRQAIDRAVSGYPADDLFWQRERERHRHRPVVAYISNGMTPYGLHFLRRVAHELPEIDLRCLYTHQYSMGEWVFGAQPQLLIRHFGPRQWAFDANKPSRIPQEWIKAGKIIQELQRCGAQCVVLLGYNDIGRLRIIEWCHRVQVPCFLWGDSNIRGDLASGTKAIVKKVVLRQVMRRLSGALPCGSLGQAYFEKYGIPKERVFLVPNEPDYRLISELPAEFVRATAERFSIDTERRRIIFSGRLVTEKRVDLLIAAFTRIAAQRPDWDLLIVGNGPLRSQLGAMVPSELKHRVIWPGFLGDQRYVSAFYRLADVLVLPSDYEPWALVINEAAAAGLAIVASDVVGAAAELVREGVNGRVFLHGDCRALTQALLGVTAPDAIGRMRRASPELLQEWRNRADPVDGLRKALCAAGVLPLIPLAGKER